MEQAERHPEDVLGIGGWITVEKSIPHATPAMVVHGSIDLLEIWNKAVELQREVSEAKQDLTKARRDWDAVRENNVRLRKEIAETGKLRDELTQAREDAERDRSALEATYKRQQELEKERDLAISNRDTLLYLFHEAKEAAARRMQLLEEVDRERRRRTESCLWCNGVADHDSSCMYLKEKRAEDSCPACGAATPDGEPCLACAEYAIDSVRAPSDVPELPTFCDSKEYFLALDAAVRWLIERERGKI